MRVNAGRGFFHRTPSRRDETGSRQATIAKLRVIFSDVPSEIFPNATVNAPLSRAFQRSARLVHEGTG
jgi:hypothetical protein